MTVNNFATYIGYFLGLLIILITAVICRSPLKILLKILFNSAVGCIFIFLINHIFSFCNFYIGINPVTALYLGILGVPGAITLLILKILI